MAELPPGSYGSVTLKGTVVTNNTETTTGNFYAKSASLTNLSITTGSLNAKDSTFDGSVNITSGSITLENTIVNHNATMAAAGLNIQSSTAKSIVMSSDSEKNLCVNIVGKSFINGDLSFVNNQGLVYLENGSTISGKVIGGKFVSQACNS